MIRSVDGCPRVLRSPHKGQSVMYEDYRFVIEETENKRISRIRLIS